MRSASVVEVAKDLDFSPEDVQTMLDNIDQFSAEEVAEIDKMVDELANSAGFELEEDNEMPANNRLLVWRSSAVGPEGQ